VTRFWPLLLPPLLIIAGAQMSRNEAAVVDTLRSLPELQARFLQEDLDGDSFFDYATDLADLRRAGLIDDTFASGILWDYTVNLSGSTSDWVATATGAGTRNFAISTSGVVRFSTEGP
jgi:hypothetical protein